MAYNTYKQKYSEVCSKLCAKGVLRSLKELPQEACSTVKLDFSTNDYLSLSKDQSIIASAISAAHKYGVGSTGSRLLSGNHSIFKELEDLIAKDKKTESSLVFNTGFQANFSTLSCLLDKTALSMKPVVLFDRLNHSSLYQAVFASDAELIRYRHNDAAHLRSIFENLHSMQPKFLVAETVFGMDGDILNKEIIKLAKHYSAFIYLDEAHATGVIGPDGYGLSEVFNLNNHPHVVMGTFSKALGGSGAYVACDNVVKQYLVNKASGFIYATANSPINIAAALAAWKMIPNLTKERKHLQDLGFYMRNRLQKEGVEIGSSQSHIIPIILEDEELTLIIKRQLFEKYGIIVSAILPPTVPPGTARLRITLVAKHSKEDVDYFCDALEFLVKTLKPSA